MDRKLKHWELALMFGVLVAPILNEYTEVSFHHHEVVMSGTSARFTLKSELISLISEKNPDFLTWRFWITSYNCTCMEEIPVLN